MRVDVGGRSLDEDLLARMCSSKFRYQTKAKAKKRLKAMNSRREQRGEGPLRIYHCPVCNGWHFTSSMERRHDR